MELVLALIFASIVTLGFAFASLGQSPEQRRLARLAGDASRPRPRPSNPRACSRDRSCAGSTG